jgi:hypothetical protein
MFGPDSDVGWWFSALPELLDQLLTAPAIPILSVQGPFTGERVVAWHE